jgi:hypothetical protein
VGCKITINTDTRYVSTITYISGKGITIINYTGAHIEEATVTLTADRVVLYNNLSINVAVGSTVYLDIINAEGLYIGTGWIKSEHNMPIGSVISEREVMVVNNKLLFGYAGGGTRINYLKSVILRIGLSKFVSAVLRNINTMALPYVLITSPNNESAQTIIER